ncbi:MAG TPA: hypothetical protein VN706_05180 [Gemmatimonadaceae bacterium]|nr:hypothetical protein [Gemmatimonadaceae bacterium]
MKHMNGRAGLIAASVAMIGLAACSNKSQTPVDDGLKADLAAATGGQTSGDLQLAPKSAQSQMIDAEDAPVSAPKRASVKHIPTPTPKPAPRVASNDAPAPAPAPAPQATVVETAPTPQPQAQEPAPAPVMAPQPVQQPQRQQRGVYKTEGEIFKQMPWIRP